MRANRHRIFKPPAGLTLLELLVTIAIAAILLTIAVPNLQSLFINNRLVTNSNNFVASLNTARSEAIRRGASVSLRKNSATSGDWGSAGWTMFVDSDADGTLDVGETTLKIDNALPSPLTLYANNNFVNFIRFTPSGQSNNSGTFVICYDGVLQQGGDPRSRAIIVNATGRVRVAQDTNGDGIPNKDDTTNVSSCTNP
ncbi:MAG: GspH/FimT family pseudopilin [Hydrogenophilaceae bacterium]|nr:GspH/FimT family pseudopilin [Hydrogenophilaceae bacterium]